MIKLFIFNDTHLDNTLQWMQDSDLKKMFLLEKDITKESHENWFAASKCDPSQEIYAIEYNEIHVGNIGLKNMDPKNRKTEVWVYLGDLDYRGKGIAKKSLMQLINKKSTDFHKFYAHIADFNYASLKTFSSAGFHTEAILLKDLIYKEEFINLFRLYILI